MKLKNKKIGLGITGSFCNFNRLQEVIRELKSLDNEIIPIISNSVKNHSTRFYKKEDFKEMLEKECLNKVLDTIVETEPIGPKNMLDVLVILPCSGNTLAKIANGITDTPVLMAFKSHIRNNKPVVIGLSTNDAMGSNFKNIGEVYNMKNIYFVPFGQDDYVNKPKSLVLDYSKLVSTIEEALDGVQIQPVLKL